LRLALQARPWAASPNASECAATLGLEENPRMLVRALAELVDHAMVTLGSEGLVYAHGDAVWRVSPPGIQTVNAVGSGDAFVAGFLAGITRGLPALEAIRRGVACGASNAARFEPGIGSLSELEHLSKLVRIEPVASISHPP
jgi:tagatose 6-phosphate kinase